VQDGADSPENGAMNKRAESNTRKSPCLPLAVALTWLFSAGCNDDPSAIDNTMNDPTKNSSISLPRPSQQGERSFEETLANRRSVREFTSEPLNKAEMSQLLWAAQGITHPEGLRTAPSAGALYPLELYVSISSGLYHYDPADHEMRIRDGADLRRPLYRAALSQNAIIEAPAVFVITAVYSRTAQKYGARAARYVHIEVGHAAQNLLLEAVALDLAGFPIGAFDDDDRVSEVLQLPSDETPLYLVPIGHPR
jgi:SagB-type dehydrogenase family enzyme